MQNISLITPNAWGIDTYYKLVQGGTSQVVVVPTLALLGMTVVLFFVSAVMFRKRYA